MQKLKIVTDSSCTMEKSVRDELGISVVPLSVMIDGTLYTDDDQLSGEQFMDMMGKAKELPKTSQPPIGEFVALYDELGADGSEILSIHMTRALSGTVDAAHQASQLTKSKVTVVETDMTDQGLSFAVIRAAQMAQEGYSLDETYATVQDVLKHTKLYIGVSNLENLVKGGRISRVTGLLSSFLSIRVVMELKDSELLPTVKGRGPKTYTKWFKQFKEELNGLDNVKQIGISYAGEHAQMLEFKAELETMFPDMHIPILHTTPIIATHTGNGAFAMMYYSE
ncbi:MULTISPECIES: DegV family protein [Enterococcus]|uniref:DegV family protein n=1 Tax=Enterococcus sulfureus ATCC 49903 TaxID=1140003 RepID=S0P1M7_9ENTE|nr:DegV family protein [Enterococcus sulfureus]EOT47504.1 DegV family protein [Enterococcus sulfureus ATCC 49903]EOT84075.1 DegV family protein [Enterococcus sulfureus ATCC 49903]